MGVAYMLTDAELDESIAMTGRSCGSCSLCCRLLDVPEAGKQTGQWCPHCRPGNGCSIYADRPEVCRRWACAWLTDIDIGDEWYPLKCGIVIDMLVTSEGYPVMRFHVDPRTPDVWRSEPYYSQIKGTALRGLRRDAGFQFATVIAIAKRPSWLMVLPHTEIEWSPGIAVPIGPDHYEFIRCKDADGVRKLDAVLHTISDTADEVRRQNPSMAPMLVLEHTIRKMMALEP